MAINLESIVSLTNQKMKDLLKAVTSNVLAEGVAVILPVRRQELSFFLPMVVNDQGKAIYIGPEDHKDVTIYHRVLSIAPSTKPVQYGRTNARQAVRVTMGMVVFFKIAKVRQLPHNLSMIMMGGLPSTIKFNSDEARLTSVSVNTNSLQVFQEEFNGSQAYFLHPDTAMFRISYVLDGNLDIDCVNSCNELVNHLCHE